MILRPALLAAALAAAALPAGPLLAGDGAAAKVKDAADPDCTVGKAAKGAAMKATVGVGNRCGAAETARDVTGTDGKAKSAKKKVTN